MTPDACGPPAIQRQSIVDMLASDIGAMEVGAQNDTPSNNFENDEQVLAQMVSDMSPLIKGVADEDSDVVLFLAGAGSYEGNAKVVMRLRAFMLEHPVPNFPMLPPLTSDFDRMFELCVALAHFARLAKTHPCAHLLKRITDDIQILLVESGMVEFA